MRLFWQKEYWIVWRIIFLFNTVHWIAGVLLKRGTENGTENGTEWKTE